MFNWANCEPEMTSGANYKLKLVVKTVVREDGDRQVERVVFAECMPCPAGKSPCASCKHVAALMYALQGFSGLGYTQDTVTSTDIHQEW